MALPLTSLAQLALAQVDRVYNPTDALEPSGFFELVERNASWLYPALALSVTAMIVFGIVQAWRAQDLDVLEKRELKREVILELRKHLGGLPAEQISKAVGLESFKLVKLLEEMQRDGIILSHTSTSRLTIYRMKGVGPGAH